MQSTVFSMCKDNVPGNIHDTRKNTPFPRVTRSKERKTAAAINPMLLQWALP
jgi:hypothetical protein